MASADRLRILTAAGPRDGDLTTMCYRYTIGYKTMRVRMPHCELKWEILAKGTSYPTIDDTDVMALPIPTISTQTQGRISELLSQSYLARREAKLILDKAKRSVEMAAEEGEDKAIEFIR